MMRALRRFIGDNDMMANRLLELHRVLKPTGSLYLHCDPTASHYLKIVLDGVFGKENFRSEIIWKRTSSHNSARRWGPIHDTIFFYTIAGGDAEELKREAALAIADACPPEWNSRAMVMGAQDPGFNQIMHGVPPFYAAPDFQKPDKLPDGKV
jgi:hypothetical protein